MTAHAAPSVLTVDLGAIVDNHLLLRGLAAPVAAGAVVKADAYGLGAGPVACALAAKGCREFFVAHPQEGVGLRSALGTDPAIFVLHGVMAGEEDAFLAAGLTPVLNHRGQVEVWRRAAQRLGLGLPAALHFDTGMSRLGFAPEEASELASQRELLAGIELRYVLSHLVVSEEPDNPINADQLAAFAQLRRLWPDVRASFANSSGIFLGPDYRFDLVRAGAAQFGINPLPGRPNPMRGVVTLSARILQVRSIDPPRTVGYGAAFRARRPTRIATVAVGYADGWLRTMGNKGSAFYGNVRVPIAGRISMDLITLDVTDAPAATAGEFVELLGPHLPVDDVAAAAGTNAYEILTRLGPRPLRRYLEAPAAA